MMSMAHSKHRAHKLVEQKERWLDQLASEGPEGTHHRLSSNISRDPISLNTIDERLRILIEILK